MNDNLKALLAEFDEMGFAPTTLCEDPERQAKTWKDNLIKEIEALTPQNTKDYPIRISTKDKFVYFELPFPFGKDIFYIDKYFLRIEPARISMITVKSNGDVDLRINQYCQDGAYKCCFKYEKSDLLFVTREEAERKLKELKDNKI